MRNLWALLHRKYFRNVFASLLLVFVLPVCLLASVMTNTLRSIEQEAASQQRLMLEQFKSGMDAQLISIQRMGEKLIADEKVLYFATRDDPLAHLSSPTTFDMVRSLIAELGNISISNSAVARCYLYFPRNDKVLASGSMYTSYQFYRYNLRAGEDGYEQWLGFLQKEHNGYVRIRVGAHEEGDSLAYVRTILWGKDTAVTIVLTLDREPLAKMRDALAAQGNIDIAIYNREGEALFATNAALEGLRGVAGTPVYRVETVDGGQIGHLYSQDTGCSYALLMPDGLYGEKLREARTQIFLLLAGTLLAGVGASLVLAARNYRPVRALMAFVDGRGEGGEAPQGNDDFSYLQQVVGTIKEEKLSIAQKLRYQGHTMRDHLAERLLTGNYHHAQRVEEELLAQDWVFASDAFVVIAVRLEGFSGAGPTLGDASQDADNQLMRFAVGNVLEELLANHAQVHMLTMEGNVVALVNLPADTPEALDALGKPLQSAQALLLQHFDVGLGIVASSVHRGLPGIRHAYREAAALLRKQHQAGALLLSWRMQHAANAPLLSAWEKALGQIEAALPSEDLLPAMQTLAKQAARQGEEKGGKAEQVATRADAYIAAHYEEDGLNIAQIAEYLGIHPSYASSLYKKQTGKSMLDTINAARLTQAKKLLLGTRRSVENIATTVGYYDSAALIRTLKKYEGVTPGQYRALHRPSAPS